eukprot:CAMPEP_0119041444 /NCGR_PEP_ID=MMETSP1177-20130426/12107_1 /TAXON_ID=2985 /ORGANISM="Ochromonas sp, Strain CCMP1899" /LENGTH=423 /DNA_ID=CAMNT_0007007487 /DNA_START=288 /DNA_END=1559 /DNA_ORIENTATION=+
MNISGMTLVEDPSYRYKMPRIMAKVEGRGNGIKTVLVNVTDLGTSLNREAPEITKFFGCEIGSQTSFSADTDRAIVNGAHTAADLQVFLCRYIENFVLCQNCRLPETHYKIKAGLISQKCLACGHKSTVDMTHKLTTFILAQHKKAKEIAVKAEKGGDKKGDKKKDKKEAGEASEETKKAPVVELTDAQATAAKADKKAKKDKLKEAEGGKKKSKSRDMTAENGDNEGLEESQDAEEEETDSRAAEDGMNRLSLWLLENISATEEQLLTELRSIQTFASLKPADRIIIYLGAVFSEEMIPANQIITHKAFLATLAPTSIQQRHLIAAFEWFCGRKYPQLMKFFPMVLKQLFDEELVEEDVFFGWAGDMTRNEFTAEFSMIDIDTLEHLKNSASLFITWLQEAEEEGEDGDDDEEEDEDEEEEG